MNGSIRHTFEVLKQSLFVGAPKSQNNNIISLECFFFAILCQLVFFWCVLKRCSYFSIFSSSEKSLVLSTSFV